VVKDRNRMTGGGVTAGIDFALAVMEAVRGAAEAKAIQPAYEYAPEPPFDSFTPDKASAETLAAARGILKRVGAEATCAAQAPVAA
jgi:cyclohexyl-isocyanide hydratase